MAKKEAKANKKENNKNKKSFTKDFKAELKKVVWPTPKQLVNNTVAVITIVLITAAIVFVLDLTFESANKYGINKLKEIVATEENKEVENSEEANKEAEGEANNENEVSNENEAPAENTEGGENNTEAQQ